ncbi:MAG TPA: hypothetical protein VGN36_03560 [Sphingorhabdus sp.]|nr:hypothetical protein [Sphingorhabdus sp.]
MHKPALKLILLAGVALSPLPAFAQQIDSGWSPVDDAYGSPEEAAPQEAAPVKKKRGRGGDRREGPRVEITPYLEAQQVLVADLKGGGGDVLTYSTVAAGIDASVATRRAEAQVSLRYERLIGYDNGVEDQDIVTGLARGSVALTRNFSLEAGGVAARASVDGRGAAPTNLVGNPDNVTQVYSVYGGPTFTAQAGELSVNAAYRAGYTKVESQDTVALPAGQARFDQFDDSVSQVATASVGMQPGTLPFGWAVSGSWEREDGGQLDSRFEGKYARADVTVPLTPTFAVVGGVGYEDIEISERDAVRDINGDPVVGTDGRLVTDRTSPRLVAYQQDGLIWDAGVLWRPSPRTSVEARYGRRYGTDTYLGSLSYQPGRDWAVNVSVYDTVSGFGGMLNDNLASLPTQFRSQRNPLSGDIGGCAFGQTGGFCFNDALRSASSAAFRQRGVTASFAGTNGGWDSGFAVGYSQRKFIASQLGAQAQIDGVRDENYFAVASLGTDIDRRTRFESNVYASFYDPGFAGEGDSLSTGANAALYRQIIRGLSASAAVGLDSYKVEDFDSEITASALLGLRYSF